MLCHVALVKLSRSETTPVHCQHDDQGFGHIRSLTLKSVVFAIAWTLLCWRNYCRQSYLLLYLGFARTSAAPEYATMLKTVGFCYIADSIESVTIRKLL